MKCLGPHRAEVFRHYDTDDVVVIIKPCGAVGCPFLRVDRVRKAKKRIAKEIRRSKGPRYWWTRWTILLTHDRFSGSLRAGIHYAFDLMKAFFNIVIKEIFMSTGMICVCHIKEVPEGYRIHFHCLHDWTDFVDIQKGSDTLAILNDVWYYFSDASCHIEFVNPTKVRDKVAYAMKYVSGDMQLKGGRWWGHLTREEYVYANKELKDVHQYRVWGTFRKKFEEDTVDQPVEYYWVSTADWDEEKMAWRWIEDGVVYCWRRGRLWSPFDPP